MLINKNGSIYEQIVSHYQKFISIGVLKPNEKLPSCRELAIELGVNLKTVERAYNVLIDMGLVVSIPKKGYFVLDKENEDNYFVKEVLLKLKKDGVNKNTLLKAVDEVYVKENNNDKD